MTNSDSNQKASIVSNRQRISSAPSCRLVRPIKDHSMINRSSERIVKRTQTTPTPVKVHTPQKAPQIVASQSARPTAKQIKEEAIEKAIQSTSRNDFSEKSQKSHRLHFGAGRIVLALTCAAAAVFAIVYFVNLNAPNISLKVAAMQTGIEATYPSYIPRDFNLSGITSEDGKITLNFKNSSNGDDFSLIEENSSWDSNTLLNNYVRPTFGDDYITMREQGLTIYISGDSAAWVNGGVVYKLSVASGTLTKKQIRAIAVSL